MGWTKRKICFPRSEAVLAKDMSTLIRPRLSVVGVELALVRVHR